MSIFKKYEYWIHSGKYTAIQKLSVLLMGIFSFMLLTRMLGPSSYGVWGLFLIISSITETARNALIRNAFIRFIHQNDQENHSSLQGAAFILSMILSVILSILFFVFSGAAAHLLNAPSLEIMLKIYSVSILISVFFSQFENILNAKMNFKSLCWMYCIRQSVLLLMIVFCFIFKLKVSIELLGIFYLLSIIIGSLAGLVLSMSYLKWTFNNYKDWLSKLWQFGKYVLGTNIFSQLFRSTDNFITSYFFGTAISAYYNASLRISNLVDMPSSVLADVMFPKVAKFNVTDKSSIKYIYEKSVAANLIFSIPALLILLIFPSTILQILAGRKFIDAAPILRITAFFGFILPFIKHFGTIMDASGKPNINFTVMFSAFCINIFINWFFISHWGVIGAALGTATTYAIVFVVSQIILYKKFGINILNIFKKTELLYGEILNTVKLSLKTPVNKF